MKSAYPGPLRREPLAVELHNTRYAIRSDVVDGLESADGLRAWLAAIADRLPPSAREADPGRLQEFVDLREAVADLLHAALEGKPPPATALEAVNSAAGRAPVSPVAVVDERGRFQGEARFHEADATDVALATLASDAIELLTGPDRSELRACGAPGCVLMFLKDHPRRTWCSAVCGNRARQARHYERARRSRR
jgi:predicted RNA-binding Zn ribbon-like protein